MQSFLPSFLANPSAPRMNSSESPRCAQPCKLGHCTLMAEAWFTRVLSLERKRTERSREPFLLLLLDITGATQLDSGSGPLAGQLMTVLGPVTRETDVTGWYHNHTVLGMIFTEIGSLDHVDAAVNSIMSKTTAALDQLGDRINRSVVLSYHVFPEDWATGKQGPRADPLLYPDLGEATGRRWMRSAGKRMLDIAGSALALLLLCPVFLLITAVIRATSKGPALFRQERVGQFGKSFEFLKFRSMYTANNHQIHEQYVKQLIQGRAGIAHNGIFKIQNDPRVTPVGRFLRKTSLDELPQFWNVLKAEMSLVGPRPPLPYEVGVYDIWHRRRLLEAKPGITGLWQVSGRSRTCFDDMVRLDLHYTRSSCLWLDLKILLRTPRAVLAGDGAC